MATQTKNGKSRGCSSWLVKPKNWWSLRYSNIINKNVNKVQMAFLSNILGKFFETKTWTGHVLEIAYFNIWKNHTSTRNVAYNWKSSMIKNHTSGCQEENRKRILPVTPKIYHRWHFLNLMKLPWCSKIIGSENKPDFARHRRKTYSL